MRRFTPTVAAAAGLAALLFAATFLPPNSAPLPSKFPSVIRIPPPAAVPRGDNASASNPGPSIRALHERGIRGRGMGIAIIDQCLLTTHEDYRDRLRWYDELDMEPGDTARWHGTAVASIAAGRAFGVAPEADLYFIGIGANWSGEPWRDWFVAARRAMTARNRLATAIHRILDVNRRLPADRRIQAISISIGWGPRWMGYEESRQAVEEARRAGLFVSAIDMPFERIGNMRTAAPAGSAEYLTNQSPAGSWGIAHLAGRYLLAVEQVPSLGPAAFVEQVKSKTGED